MLVWKDLVKIVYFIYIFIWSFFLKGYYRVCGSISLIKGLKNVVVDIGNLWDRDYILDGMYMCVFKEKNVVNYREWEFWIEICRLFINKYWYIYV